MATSVKTSFFNLDVGNPNSVHENRHDTGHGGPDFDDREIVYNEIEGDTTRAGAHNLINDKVYIMASIHTPAVAPGSRNRRKIMQH